LFAPGSGAASGTMNEQNPWSLFVGMTMYFVVQQDILCWAKQAAKLVQLGSV
jgi:hypothetical protein